MNFLSFIKKKIFFIFGFSFGLTFGFPIVFFFFFLPINIHASSAVKEVAQEEVVRKKNAIRLLEKFGYVHKNPSLLVNVTADTLEELSEYTITTQIIMELNRSMKYFMENAYVNSFINRLKEKLRKFPIVDRFLKDKNYQTLQSYVKQYRKLLFEQQDKIKELAEADKKVVNDTLRLLSSMDQQPHQTTIDSLDNLYSRAIKNRYDILSEHGYLPQKKEEVPTVGFIRDVVGKAAKETSSYQEAMEKIKKNLSPSSK